MNLRPDPDHLALAERTRAALVSGDTAALPTTGSAGQLAAVARESGRAAGPGAFHSAVLARLLGHHPDGPVAVALRSHDGLADHVPHAAGAAHLVVVVDAHHVAPLDLGHPSVRRTPQPTLSDGDAARVEFDPGALGPSQTVDVRAAVAIARIVLAADCVGAAEAALDAAVAHVREREVFGAPLAELQVVQHRCADMLIDVTLARDAVLDAAHLADRGEPEAAVAVTAAAAKATAVERARRVTAAAHQLAGGAGILAEAPYQRWYRRVKDAEPRLGRPRDLRAEVARAALGFSDRGPNWWA